MPVSHRRVVGAAASVSALGVITPHLVGTLALPIRRELGFDEAALGLAVGSRALFAAILSYHLGRLAQRLGPERAVRVAAVGAAVVTFGIAIAVASFAWLIVALAAAGVVHALGQPAADLWLVRGVPATRQGLAFGVKQAAMPGASLLAGLAVPIFAVTLGWRWAFAAVGVMAVGVAVAVPSGPTRPVTRARVSRSGDAPLSAMSFLVVGMVLASTAPNALTTFLVSSLVEAGLSEPTAGWLFAGGALCGIGSRVALGHAADRWSRPLIPAVVTMLVGGAVGYLLLATMSTSVVLLASPLVFALAWGWPGIFFLAVARINPNAPAAAAGIVNGGAFVGAMLGPLLFGYVARVSYGLAWTLVAGACLGAAGFFVLGLHQLRRWRARAAGTAA